VDIADIELHAPTLDDVSSQRRAGRSGGAAEEAETVVTDKRGR
jgi:hypothetical protein